MNAAEVEKILSRHGVHPRAYSIEGRNESDGQYRLEKSGTFWCVYYYERGNRSDARNFVEEKDACEWFIDLLLGDPATR